MTPFNHFSWPFSGASVFAVFSSLPLAGSSKLRPRSGSRLRAALASLLQPRSYRVYCAVLQVVAGIVNRHVNKVALTRAVARCTAQDGFVATVTDQRVLSGSCVRRAVWVFYAAG